MNRDVHEEIRRLRDAGVAELQRRYREVFNEAPRSRHRTFLWKRIAWRLQALSEGDLSERARQRAKELANDADIRLRPPREMIQQFAPAPPVAAATQISHNLDPRLPMPGTLLRREFRGRQFWDSRSVTPPLVPATSSSARPTGSLVTWPACARMPQGKANHHPRSTSTPCAM